MSASELPAELPFVREAMSSTFGVVFRATRPGERPGVLHHHAGALRGALRESGAILLRGFGFDVAEFERVSSLFSERAMVHPSTTLGNRLPVTETTATVDSGVLPLPWHAELGYAPHRPALVAFMCQHAPAGGGETLLTDGGAIADGLSDATRAVARGRIRYRFGRLEPTWPVAFDGARSPRDVERVLREQASRLGARDELTWAFRRRGGRGVRIEFTTPMISAVRWGDRRAFCNHVIWQERRRRDHGAHPVDLRRFLRPTDGVALEDGSRVPAEAVDEFERLADEAAYAIEWRRGDVAVVDNSRVMHARGAVLDTSRRILARMSDAAF
jgi:alpha-ketoglutarate-dependent taurine dioxygenase